MTPKEAEEIINSRWLSEQRCYLLLDEARRNGCIGYPDCDGTLIGEEHEPECPSYIAPENLVIAAAEFTLQREEEIRQKREEIRFLRDDVSYNTHVDAEKIIKRVLAALEAQLAALLVGWKETP